MLVLTRKREERIHIGPDITITVLRIKGRMVKLGVEAPEGVRVLRAELVATPTPRDPPPHPSPTAPESPTISPGGTAPCNPARGDWTPAPQPDSPIGGGCGPVRPRRRAPRAADAPHRPLTMHVGPALAAAAPGRLRCAR